MLHPGAPQRANANSAMRLCNRASRSCSRHCSGHPGCRRGRTSAARTWLVRRGRLHTVPPGRMPRLTQPGWPPLQQLGMHRCARAHDRKRRTPSRHCLLHNGSFSRRSGQSLPDAGRWMLLCHRNQKMPAMTELQSNCAGIARRDFLNSAWARCSAWTDRPAAPPRPGGQRFRKVSPDQVNCILIWMDGGPSHYETFDPSRMRRRKSAATSLRSRRRFPEFILRNGAKAGRHRGQTDDVRSICHRDPNHGGGNHYMMTGAPTPVPVMRRLRDVSPVVRIGGFPPARAAKRAPGA